MVMKMMAVRIVTSRSRLLTGTKMMSKKKTRDAGDVGDGTQAAKASQGSTAHLSQVGLLVSHF